jgi:hypothetical protein
LVGWLNSSRCRTCRWWLVGWLLNLLHIRIVVVTLCRNGNPKVPRWGVFILWIACEEVIGGVVPERWRCWRLAWQWWAHLWGFRCVWWSVFLYNAVLYCGCSMQSSSCGQLQKQSMSQILRFITIRVGEPDDPVTRLG